MPEFAAGGVAASGRFGPEEAACGVPACGAPTCEEAPEEAATEAATDEAAGSEPTSGGKPEPAPADGSADPDVSPGA